MTQVQISKEQPTIVRAALFGLCPECGAPTLFANILQFSSRCRNCSLDYSGFNVGDGPAALITMILGALVISMAIGLQIIAHPPFWVQALLWVPLTAILTVLLLRIAKAGLLFSEYRNEAGEGKSANDGGEA
jgi:uncharacterized protein (DUF983 family)